MEIEKPLNLEQAADFLSMNAEVLRRKAAKGIVPASKKLGKWRFIRKHLENWISYGGENLAEAAGELYIPHGRLLRVIDGGKQSCQSLNEQTVKTGSFKSPYQTVSAYNIVLGRTTNNKPKNSTTA